MSFWYRLFLFTLLLSSAAFSQYLDYRFFPAPKREFRAAWIATVTNIDWPLTWFDLVSKQQTDLLALLDSLQRARINAVIFQIRPSCDAFYQSSIEPWSQWLTGTQGVAPNPFYDPLQFLIDACRARGMEIHAWFNPYRAVNNVITASIASNHVTVTKPYLIRDYQASGVPIKVLDPGHPETIPYVVSVIMDVLRRYDIDGVHFDDYFYPYPVSGLPFPDSQTYGAYGGGLSLSEWRRDNVNRLIRTVNDSIQAVKPRVKFGISPFGIWRNQATDPAGSGTNGLQSFDDIYADSRKWLQQGWIDYLAPQLYWTFTNTAAPYGVLTDWWNQNNTGGRHLFIGHLTANAVTTSGWSIQELINQIEFNRTFLRVNGSIHFSAKYFHQSAYAAKKLTDSLRSSVYPTLALIPTMIWEKRDAVPPNRPDSLRVTALGNSFFFTWAEPSQASDGEKPLQYLVYRSTSFPVDINDMRNTVQMSPSRFYGDSYPTSGTAAYTVTALDKNQNESAQSSTVIVSSTGNVLVGILGEETVLLAFDLQQNYPNPFNAATIIQYRTPYEIHVTLKVYDVLGREVAVLVDQVVGAGVHQTSFDARAFASGLYVYRLFAGGQAFTKKMQLLK